MTRLLTGLTLAGALLALLVYGPLSWMLVAIAVIAFVAAFELAVMVRQAGAQTYPMLAAAGSSALVLSYRFETLQLGAVLAVLLGVCWTVAIARGSDPAAVARGAMWTIFSAIYVGFGLGAIVGLMSAFESLQLGRKVLFFALLSVYAADTFAYYGGRALGKRKLAPWLSPGKTVAGFISGLLAGAVFGGVASWALELPWASSVSLTIGIGAVAGLSLAFLGALGDLVESAIKRLSGVKDSGAWLPGHGGVLDRVDSLLLALPLLYWLIAPLVATL